MLENIGSLEVAVAVVAVAAAVYFTQGWLAKRKRPHQEIQQHAQQPQQQQQQGQLLDPSSNSSNPEDVRRLRLQRFEAESNKVSPSSSSSSSSSSPTPTSKPIPTATPTPTPIPNPNSNSNSNLTTPAISKPSSLNTSSGKTKEKEPLSAQPASSNTSSSASTVTPSATSLKTSSSSIKSTPSSSSSISPSSPPTPAVPLSPEALIHKIICDVFLVTINPKSVPGVKAFYLPELSVELQETTKSYLDTAMLDSVIVERTIGCTRAEALEYFLASYKRSVRAISQYEKNGIQESLQEIQRFIATYSGLVLLNTFPESTTTNPTRESSKGLMLIPYLEGTSNEDVPVSFLNAVCTNLEESEIQQAFGILFTFFSGKLNISTLLDNFTPSIRAMVILTAVPALAKLFVKLQNFIPATTNGYTFEQTSLVCALFRFTPMLDTVGQHYFSNPQQLTRPGVETAWSGIRFVLQPYHDLLAEFSRNLLKSDTRDQYLTWVSALLDTNRARTKMHFDRSAVSSDGLLANVGTVLMVLCEPFTSNLSEKWKNIDSNYIVHSTRISFINETKLGASEEEVKNYLKQLDEEDAANMSQDPSKTRQYHFITEAFFLTLYTLHVGLITTGNYYIELNQTLGRIMERKKQVEAMPHSQFTDHALLQLNQQADALLIMQLAIDSVLANGRTVQLMTNFYAFTAEWLLRLLDPEQTGVLTQEPPLSFKFVPEFVVEDLMSYVMWMIRVHPDKLSDTVAMEKIVRFSIHLIASPLYIRNPYLRSKLVSFLSELVPKESDRTDLARTNLFSLIATHKLAHSHLVPGLISLYIDIEVTGRNSQFYDKLFVRREIALLLKHLRNFNEFIASLKRESKNTSKFFKFIHMLLGDAHYLVDEILIKLKDIHTVQVLQESDTWNQMDEDFRREREQTHAHTENQVKTFCTLANETIDLLVFFTEHVKDPFLEGDMAERLANMVNYFVAQLAGPKCRELKVKNPAKYAFQPRVLLTQIIRVYLNLANMPTFVTAVGSDQRSFSLQLFTTTTNILRREMMLPEEDIKRFEQLILQADKQATELKLKEQEMADAPEEFIDPLLGVVMENPVTLPVSGQTVDRATILRHLMSVPTDPFSRTPLTEDQLTPNTELKAKIDAWKNSKNK